MADITDKIRNKYNIDIKKINIIKLYKIDDANIVSDELEKKIEECRKKWAQSINGANEKFAERDKAHLDNADKYEAILRDKKFRNELFAYYNKSTGDDSVLEFAREYFKLVGDTKKIHKNDVDFFFDFYQNQRKNKKAILEMLKKEFKVLALVKESNEQDELEEAEPEGKKKNNKSLMISNMFQEATILKLRKCENFYLQACQNENMCTRFPQLKNSLYMFLQLNQYNTLTEFMKYVETQRTEVSNLRYDKGQEYATLVDLFNTLSEILEYNDVVDNFTEFKLLIQYFKLTPYMYRFEDVKPGLLKEFFCVATRDYGFRDINDFILSYFVLIYDNFGIYNQSIKGMLKNAEKKAGQKKVLDKIDKAFGISREKKMSFGAKVVHAFTYWPIYVLFAFFEVTKFVVDNLRYISLVGFIPMLILIINKGPELYGVKFTALRGIVSKDVWYAFLDDFIGLQSNSMFEIVLASLIAIVLLLMFYIFPAVMGTVFLWLSASRLTKKYDWKGIERTLQMICKNSRRKSEEQYAELKGKLYSKMIPSMIINLVCLAIVILLIYFAPVGISFVEDKTGFEIHSVFSHSNNKESDEVSIPEVNESDIEENNVSFEITAETANIRKGAGTEYDIVTTANCGATFIGTDNQEIGSTGSTWYEIYLDETQTETGWASEKVMQKID